MLNWKSYNNGRFTLMGGTLTRNLTVYEEVLTKYHIHIRVKDDIHDRLSSYPTGDICIGSLPNIKCPTLIVNGHKDPLVPQEHPQFLQKHIVGCRY